MNAEERNKHFLLLQVNDALFPIGAYSHSYGLETYIQKNLVSTEEDAWDFLYRRLRYGFCYNEFLSGRLAFEYAARGNLKKLDHLEELLDASRIPRETREAGHKLGSRFVKTVSNMEISFASDIFTQYCANRKGSWMSHSVVYGVFCAAAGIPLEDAMEHYLYAQASSMVTNCVKTIPLSQTCGQKLLCRCQEVFQEILECLGGLTEEDLCLSAPGFDIRSMQHEGLYSRIYMS
ncbi:MAG: urease accessory protein UreF [Lachnospiraceae bacterium]|nr:urease accessory protein UreF [Lachnospiraceae bacterium]